MNKKMRLDVFLVENGLVESRSKAQALIMSRKVQVNDKIQDKAGFQVKPDVNIDINDDMLRYVSRGGLKLEKALQCFNIDVCQHICIDVGASTGGFTDCLLQNNAEKVYAVDVGYGQFAWKLRNDPRVVVFEKENVRYFTADRLEQLPDIAVIDVSFIGLTKVLEPVSQLLHFPADIIALIKPQFEAHREDVGKGGVIRDPAVHEKVKQKIREFCDNKKWTYDNIIESPIQGPKGNREFLIHIHIEERVS